MNIDDIIATKEKLNNELRVALATMEKKDIIRDIKRAIEENQARCPHFSTKYNWTIADGHTCPYCGKNDLRR